MSQPTARDHDCRDDRRAAPRSDPDRRVHHDAIFTLARAAEAHDAETGAHLLRIRELVRMLAREMGLDEADADAMGHDAMLHDVGKMCVPHTVLCKPGPLTPTERRAMEDHTTHGERIISSRFTLERAARIALHHHEAWNGSGYPNGVKGEDIPIEARITAVADRFDALVSERSYKAGWSIDDTVAEARRLSGNVLDPQVVAALDRLHARGALEAMVSDE